MLNFRNQGCGIELMESIQDRSTPLVRTIMSAAEEKQRIADGHPVLLWIWGTGLPPVAVGAAE